MTNILSLTKMNKKLGQNTEKTCYWCIVHSSLFNEHLVCLHLDWECSNYVFFSVIVLKLLLFWLCGFFRDIILKQDINDLTTTVFCRATSVFNRALTDPGQCSRGLSTNCFIVNLQSWCSRRCSIGIIYIEQLSGTLPFHKTFETSCLSILSFALAELRLEQCKQPAHSCVVGCKGRGNM